MQQQISLRPVSHVMATGNLYVNSSGELYVQQAAVKLYIRGMVSLRCVMVVKQMLQELSMPYSRVELGEVTLNQKAGIEKMLGLNKKLTDCGLTLIENRRTILVERIKGALLEMVMMGNELPVINFSVYLSRKLSHDYTYLSNVFSQETDTTIANYIVMLKVDRVKELLLADELNITEISYKLNYCNVGYLCNQFKKVTGQTPGAFKSSKGIKAGGMYVFS